MKDVYQYLDYREFLKDYYEHKKTELLFFSYRFFAKKIGINYSILVRILNKSLHLSEKKIEGVIKACHLNEKEGNFFEVLVCFNKAKNAKNAQIYFDKLLSIKSFRQDVLLANQFEFFKKWYYTALWTFLQKAPFTGNFKELGLKLNPSLSVAETKSAIKLLVDLGLVEKDAQGTYRAIHTNVTTGQAWHSLAITEYQKAMIQLGYESLDRFPKKYRDVSTVTINLPRESLEEIREFIGKFRRSMIKLAEGYTVAGSVYQLNIQLFPLTNEEAA
jgi:uncharacterized protein (TIGR02147 family)